MKGFTSRKFILCCAAFLGSLGTSIAALHTDNEKVAAFGIVCAVLSAAIYAAVEAYVDGKAVTVADETFDLLMMDDAEYEMEDEEEEGEE